MGFLGKFLTNCRLIAEKEKGRKQLLIALKSLLWCCWVPGFRCRVEQCCLPFPGSPNISLSFYLELGLNPKHLVLQPSHSSVSKYTNRGAYGGLCSVDGEMFVWLVHSVARKRKAVLCLTHIHLYIQAQVQRKPCWTQMRFSSELEENYSTSEMNLQRAPQKASEHFGSLF